MTHVHDRGKAVRDVPTVSDRRFAHHHQPTMLLVRQSLTRVAARQSTFAATRSPARNMATLREIELRLKSVRNIQKITGVRPSILGTARH